MSTLSQRVRNDPDTAPSRYAEVILPLALPAMTFAVPHDMEHSIALGSGVLVPFGATKFYSGVVCALHDRRPAYAQIKPLSQLLRTERMATPEQLRLWSWLADYYMCPLGAVLRAALPAIMKSNGQSEAEVLEESYHRPQEAFLGLAAAWRNQQSINTLIDSMQRCKAQRNALTEFLAQAGTDWDDPSTTVRRAQLTVSSTTINLLIKKGIFEQRMGDVIVSTPLKCNAPLPSLSSSQQTALRQIQEAFDTKAVTLLHGITGSGKTELYITLIDEALRAGHNVLYMLPEIALTSQLIARMEAHFGHAVVVYHSRLSDRRRGDVYDLLQQCEGGRLVIGVRSAVLLPLRNLSLIIVDEEHDSSFKQSDTAPRYNGRDTAIMLGLLCGAHTLLGSATPSAESYYNALNGKYGHVSLGERYTGVELPRVVVADTIHALRRGEKVSHFTKALTDRIGQTLDRGRQVLLFQNRRGFSPYVECDLCGWTGRCPHCNVSLTYHHSDQTLRCHYCGYHTPLPKRCPSCGKGTPHTCGFGTEKIEQELTRIFPKATIARLDSDTAQSTVNYRRIVTRFEQGLTDILVGTQIVTKGFDFGGVELVGILNADNLLNYPDFRAGERAFQLIMQVGGRAGRRDRQGTVLIQTSQPQHPVIQQASDSDYGAMIRSQLSEREAFIYPPYCRLIVIMLRHRDPRLLQRAATAFAQSASACFGDRLLGPEPPPIDRIRSLYRLQFMLKIARNEAVAPFKATLTELIDTLHHNKDFRAVEIFADVDPQ